MTAQDFVNSRSMLTPGIAGAMCMLLANSLGSQFGMQDYLPHVVLALSFLVGLLVFSDKAVPWYIRVALYVFNSLFIFSTATGSNEIGNRFSTHEEKIKDTILPIEAIGKAANDEPLDYFLVVQAIDSTRLRKQSLSQQIVSTSTMIQAVQKEIKVNADKYNDPVRKFNTLKGINRNLVLINQEVLSDDTVTRAELATYQAGLLEVNHNLGVLQKALLLEEKKTKPGFFKPWFNKE